VAQAVCSSSCTAIKEKKKNILEKYQIKTSVNLAEWVKG
jgi:hypothetical protein